jgi:hypothetical protein
MSEETRCNLCGLSCQLGDKSPPINFVENYGLIGANVVGGYFSTPGNGYGALDDMVDYRFSMCEFCLDWLFTQFTIPVKISGTEEAFKPAIQRVFEDDWRKEKETFYQEYLKRSNARSKEFKTVEKCKKLQLFK